MEVNKEAIIEAVRSQNRPARTVVLNDTTLAGVTIRAVPYILLDDGSQAIAGKTIDRVLDLVVKAKTNQKAMVEYSDE